MTFQTTENNENLAWLSKKIKEKDFVKKYCRNFIVVDKKKVVFSSENPEEALKTQETKYGKEAVTVFISAALLDQ
jgi:hypothetical protein